MERLAMQTSRQTAWTQEQLRQQQRQDLEEAGVTDFSDAKPDMPPTARTANRAIATSSDPLQSTSF